MQVGEINIDNSLVVDQLLSKEDLVSMDKGCVCCSLRHDIVKALRELQRRATVRGSAYDCILLETTGLADPAPVAFTFFSNAWISANFRLDSIICLVDAQHISKHLEDASHGVVHEAVNQIAFADVILLNKIDLVTEEQLQHARDLVRSINVTAELIECSLNGATAEELPTWDTLMGINSFSIERALQVDPYFLDSDGEEEDDASPRATSQQQQQVPQQLPAIPEAAVPQAAEPAAAGRTSTAVDAAAQREPDSMATAAAVPDMDKVELVGKRKAPEGEAAELGECKRHAGPCTEQCAARHAGDAKEAVDDDKQQLQEQAAAQTPTLTREDSQRQPRRRRKKLHDLSGVGAIGITARGPLDKHRFNMFMRDLLGEKARDIFRSKGVLSIKGQEKTKFMFQGVHETICFGPAASGWADGEEPINQIVFIGRNLNRKDLVDGLRSCVWVPLPEGWQEHMDPRTNQPYFVNTVTGTKQWERPEGACALVHYSESSHMQPRGMQPASMAAAEAASNRARQAVGA
ncbi:hypothetical protein N2152v2_006535 [Parachlorella kessleri]